MIQIGNEIVLKVIHAGREYVKIGIEAPRHVRVLRSELCGPLPANHPLSKFLEERRALRKGNVKAPSTPSASAVKEA
jgi:carbon storage regulator CsrA